MPILCGNFLPIWYSWINWQTLASWLVTKNPFTVKFCKVCLFMYIEVVFCVVLLLPRHFSLRILWVENAVTIMMAAVTLQANFFIYWLSSQNSLISSAVVENSLTEQQSASYLWWLSQQISKVQSCWKPMCSGLTTEAALVKMRLSEIPAAAQNCFVSQEAWEQEKSSFFKDFLRWYNNKDAVPTLEAMQKFVEINHNKSIDMVKLAYTKPKLANGRLDSSPGAEFHQPLESDKDSLSKVHEDLVEGPPIVFTSKAVVDDTHIRKPTNVCESIVGIDASQLYPLSMSQHMPAELYTRNRFDAGLQRFKPRQNNDRNSGNLVKLYFQLIRRDCKIERFYTTWTQKLRKGLIVPMEKNLWTLQNNVWSNGLIIPLLYMSRGTTCSNWRKHSTWNKKRNWEVAEKPKQ